MKFLRFKNKEGNTSFGYIKNNNVFEILGDIFGPYHFTETAYAIDEVRLLAPCSPSKIVAVGLNYRDHAEELKKKIPDEPLLFLKPSTSIIGHEDKIIYPNHMSSR